MRSLGSLCDSCPLLTCSTSDPIILSLNPEDLEARSVPGSPKRGTPLDPLDHPSVPELILRQLSYTIIHGSDLPAAYHKSLYGPGPSYLPKHADAQNLAAGRALLHDCVLDLYKKLEAALVWPAGFDPVAMAALVKQVARDPTNSRSPLHSLCHVYDIRRTEVVRQSEALAWDAPLVGAASRVIEVQIDLQKDRFNLWHMDASGSPALIPLPLSPVIDPVLVPLPASLAPTPSLALGADLEDIPALSLASV